MLGRQKHNRNWACSAFLHEPSPSSQNSIPRRTPFSNMFFGRLTWKTLHGLRPPRTFNFSVWWFPSILAKTSKQTISPNTYVKNVHFASQLGRKTSRTEPATKFKVWACSFARGFALLVKPPSHFNKRLECDITNHILTQEKSSRNDTRTIVSNLLVFMSRCRTLNIWEYSST